MSAAMQRSVGNNRVGSMLGAATPPGPSAGGMQAVGFAEAEGPASTARIGGAVSAAALSSRGSAKTGAGAATIEAVPTGVAATPLKLPMAPAPEPESTTEGAAISKPAEAEPTAGTATGTAEAATGATKAKATEAAVVRPIETPPPVAETAPVEAGAALPTPAAEAAPEAAGVAPVAKPPTVAEAATDQAMTKAEDAKMVEAEAREKAVEGEESTKAEKTEEAAKAEQEKKADEAVGEKAAAKPEAKSEAESGRAAPTEAASAAKEAAAGAAGVAFETGKPEAVAASGGAPMPAAAAVGGGGGGAAGVGAAAGGEPQGGSEEEGASELEERLAKADPERAAADEADPADVARGEPISAEGEEPEAESEVPEPSGGPAGEAVTTPTAIPTTPTAPGAEAETAPIPETAVTPAMTETGGPPEIAEGSTAPEPVEAPAAEEEPGSAEGFSGDEPALGGGALERSETVPELSEPEKQAAMESLSESTGGGSEGGGGGGGGGGAVPETTPPEVPNVSAEEPGTALAKVGGLPPVQLKQALGGVNAAVGNSAGEKRAELAANPPTMERPTGSPKNLHGEGPAEAKPAGEGKKKVEQAPEGQDRPTPEPKALPEPPPSPAERVREPMVTGGEGGKLSESDVSRMASSMGSMPTKDPGLNATAGPAPKVELSGNADPAQTGQQRAKLQASLTETQTQGRAYVAQEMGENTKIYPSVPPETLTAKVPQGGGGAGGAGAGGGAVGSADPEALSIIAQKEKGGEIQAALAKAQGDLAAKKEEYGTKVGEEKAKSAKDIAALEEQSAADQAEARAQAQAEVRAKKTEWTEEQEQTVREANKEADAEVEKGRKDIQKKQQDADKEAADHIDKGNEEAERERRKAEDKAAEKKREGKKESKGFFGWLASKAKAFFNKIKEAVKAAFDLARKLIKKVIEAAKKAAMWAIEQARKAIVAAIKLVGKALIAIGDRLLAAFPALRDKFRKFIQDKVDKAVAKVNEYADKLKKGVSALLDALAAGLDKLIGWLEKGMLAVIDAYAAVVEGAIKFAEKVAQALGAFVVLIKDIAAGPGRWIKNLAAGVVDGIKNHLWKAFKEAVQQWFNSKLEQVLGLGKMVWDLIKSGGLALAKVGKMAWEGIKSMIPPTLIRILVEKLAAMIVPAAGAVMVIIEGLQAAWGAVQRIIAAFQKFFAFLKAVRTGNAGPSFAQALAAAAIAVIDFVANWLIAKLAKGASKIGGKIKALAKKILGRKKGKARGRKAKAKPAKKPKAKKPARKAAKPKKPRKSGKEKKADRKKEKDKKERNKRQRQEKAFKAARLFLRKRLRKGASWMKLKLMRLYLKGRYRFRTLELLKSGKTFRVKAGFSPTEEVFAGVEHTFAVGVKVHAYASGKRGDVLSEDDRLARSQAGKVRIAEHKGRTQLSLGGFIDPTTGELTVDPTQITATQRRAAEQEAQTKFGAQRKEAKALVIAKKMIQQVKRTSRAILAAHLDLKHGAKSIEVDAESLPDPATPASALSGLIAQVRTIVIRPGAADAYPSIQEEVSGTTSRAFVAIAKAAEAVINQDAQLQAEGIQIRVVVESKVKPGT